MGFLRGDTDGRLRAAGVLFLGVMLGSNRPATDLVPSLLAARTAPDLTTVALVRVETLEGEVEGKERDLPAPLNASMGLHSVFEQPFTGAFSLSSGGEKRSVVGIPQY